MVDLHDAVTPRPELPDLEVGELVSRTRLSTVWKGRVRAGGSPVAVKLPADPSSAPMLLAEARTVEALEELGVTGILPVNALEHPVLHLVSPWKGGRTLRTVIDGIRGGDDRSRTAELLLKVVHTVADVHRHGFLHGDLKPENILVDKQGEPWLADFGMARAIHAARMDSRISLSMSRSAGAWGGTLPYLPPEGLQGGEPTRRWDVYALGVMLHEILLGRRPDRAATPEELLSVLPGAVVDVLLNSLAYDAADRYDQARDLRSALDAVRDELTASGSARWMMRLGRLTLTGLAAFFVALRYGSVLALLASYLALGLSAFFTYGAMLLTFLPILVLHSVIRWEGPESEEEARMRRDERVLTSDPKWRNRNRKATEWWKPRE